MRHVKGTYRTQTRRCRCRQAPVAHRTRRNERDLLGKPSPPRCCHPLSRNRSRPVVLLSHKSQHLRPRPERCRRFSIQTPWTLTTTMLLSTVPISTLLRNSWMRRTFLTLVCASTISSLTWPLASGFLSRLYINTILRSSISTETLVHVAFPLAKPRDPATLSMLQQEIHLYACKTKKINTTLNLEDRFPTVGKLGRSVHAGRKTSPRPPEPSD